MKRLLCRIGKHKWVALKHGPSLAPEPDMDARECACCRRFEIWVWNGYKQRDRSRMHSVRPA